MAAKKESATTVANADDQARAAQAENAGIAVDPAPVSATPKADEHDRAETLALDGGAVADPAPASELTEASGAIVEPAIVDAVDVTHEAIDANPRSGTSAVQNAIDLNDAKRANPTDPGFAGQGIDMSVYGTPKTDGDKA